FVLVLGCRSANTAAPDASGGTGVGSGGGPSVAGATSNETALASSGGLGGGGVFSEFPNCVSPTWQSRCSVGWCEIPPGCFVMGSPENEWGHAPIEEMQKPVTLTRRFEIQQHEVTQAEWTAAGYANPSKLVSDGGDCDEPECPVGNVTWMEAIAYANLMSELHDPPLEPCYVLYNCTGEPGAG